MNETGRALTRWLIAGGFAVIAIGAAGVLFVYFVLFSHSAPAPLALTATMEFDLLLAKA